MPIKVTTESFIGKAREIHGNKYDYSLVEYKNNYTSVKIMCREHGEFEQTPNSHLSQASGCPVCSRESQGKAKSAKAASEFATKASIIHNNKYTYKLVNYKNSCTKVAITCRLHGSWEQTPANHLSGYGCPLCSGNLKHTTQSFIQKAKEIHGDKYTYELVEYITNKIKVKITCRLHGSFEQNPGHHINNKSGCPICALSESGWTRTKFKDKCIKNNNGLGILYILGCWDDDKSEVFIKIGITSLSIQKRYGSKASMPYNYKILHEIVGSPEYIYNLETLLHKKSKNYKYIPITYFGGSSTECFEANKDYLTNLNTYMKELVPF